MGTAVLRRKFEFVSHRKKIFHQVEGGDTRFGVGCGDNPSIMTGLVALQDIFQELSDSDLSKPAACFARLCSRFEQLKCNSSWIANASALPNTRLFIRSTCG